MAADAADFLVREPVLKLEPEDLALIGGQGLQELEDPRAQLVALGDDRAGPGRGSGNEAPVRRVTESCDAPSAKRPVPGCGRR